MRLFLAILFLLALAGAGAGFALGWFHVSTSLTEQEHDRAVSVDRDKGTTDRHAASGWFEAPPSAPGHENDLTTGTGAEDREHFLQRAERRFKALELRLSELQTKAQHGRAVTKEKINQAIDDLAGKTAAARLELRELRTAPPERWDALKAHLGTSLEALEDGCQKVFSRFMNEDARLVRPGILVACGTGYGKDRCDIGPTLLVPRVEIRGG